MVIGKWQVDEDSFLELNSGVRFAITSSLGPEQYMAEAGEVLA